MKLSIPLKLSEISKILNKNFSGNDVEIKFLTGVEEASPGSLTFAKSNKFLKIAEKNGASAIIVEENMETTIPHIKSKNPQLDFIKLIKYFYPENHFKDLKGISKTAKISKNAIIGKNVYIGDYTIIMGNTQIGDNCKIFPHVVIYPNVKIGNNCVIHSFSTIRENSEIGNNVVIHNGSVIGGDGFGFVKDENGRYHKIPHVGKVIVKDNVEIQSNSCIDRAPYGATIIEEGCKIDNLVQIAHGCKIGKNCVFSSQTGIAGSTIVGENVICAGQVGIADHLKIGDNAVLFAKTGAALKVKPGEVICGYPPLKVETFRRNYVILKRLPEIFSEFKEIKKKLKEIEEKNE